MLATYSLAFGVCLLLSTIATWSVRKLSRTHGWVDTPALGRHIHNIPVPRIGGLAIYFSFMIVVIAAHLAPGWMRLTTHLPGKPSLNLLGPATIVFILGLYDDLRGVSAYAKFSIQAVAAVLLYFAGYGVERVAFFSSPHALGMELGLPITVFWVLLVTNAFNLIDGLDGLAAGSALFSTGVMFVVSLLRGNFTVSLITITLAGAILGFLCFNFNPASIFLGDSGSLFIGFLLSAVALAGSQKATTIVAVTIPLISFGLPILDVVLAVLRRFLVGKSLFAGDSDHIHHKLLKRGFSQRKAVLTLYGVTAGLGLLSLVVLHGEKMLALALALVAIGMFWGVRGLRYQEFSELLSLLQRWARPRKVLANHIAIRHAAESLNGCNEFHSICRLLQDTLKPLGFDGVRLQILNPNGFPPSSFLPLRSKPDGSLQLSWSEQSVGEPPWELRLELVTTAKVRWGYLSLIRMSDSEALHLDLSVLSGDFRTSLSNSFDRACARLEVSNPVGDAPASRVRVRTAGSTVG